MKYDPKKSYCLAVDEQLVENCNRRFLRVSITGFVAMTTILVSVIGL